MPYTLAGTGLVYLFTRNVTKALSVLMVDFSCALKLAMPISVLSAIREASLLQYYGEKAENIWKRSRKRDTIVFDKTVRSQRAEPTVAKVVRSTDSPR